MSSQEIQKRQNEMKFLKIQYAARVCFNTGEKYNYFAWLACIVSAFSIFLPNTWPALILNGVPFILDFMALNFCELSKKNVRWGARLRKYFDANVIGINISQFSKSEEHDIVEKAESVFDAHQHDGLIQIGNTGHDAPPGVRDWYEFLIPLNGADAQFECQKQNIWWDQKMTKYRILIARLAAICVVTAFILSVCLLNRDILTTLFCSSGIFFKIIERLHENRKYKQISLQIDGSKQTIEVKPEIKYLEHLQLLIDKRRMVNILEPNSIHKKIASKLSTLYSKLP